MEEQKDQDQLDEIYEKLGAGDISVIDAIKQSNALTAEITMTKAVAESNKRTQDLLTDKDVDAAETQWHEDYPDYDEVVASGQLQSYIDKSPTLIDETIAYFQWKADQRFEEGRAGTKAESKEPDGKKFLSRNELEAEQIRTIEKMKNRRPTRQEPITLSEIESQQMLTLNKIRGQA